MTVQMQNSIQLKTTIICSMRTFCAVYASASESPQTEIETGVRAV